MTMALATLCTDGLVVCADTLITQGEQTKYHEKKVASIPYKLMEKAAVLGYAGSPEKQKIVQQELERKIISPCDKTAQEIGEGFKTVLDEVFHARTKENHQLLFGFADRGALYLYKSRDREVFPVEVWDCAGWGDSPLVRYLAKIFLGDSIHLPIRLAVPICDYIIAQAKKYVPYCGGDTNLIVLTREGKAHHQIYSSQIDAACERIEYAINEMLTSATMFDIKTERCLELIGELRSLIERTSSVFGSFFPPLP